MVGGRRQQHHVPDGLSGAIVVAGFARLPAGGADHASTGVLHLRTATTFASAAILRIATLFIGKSVNKKHS